MRDKNPIGEIHVGGQSGWSFDLLATPIFWTSKAKELHRMVCLGFSVWRADTEAIRKWISNHGADQYEHKPATLTVTFFLAALAIENLLKGNLIMTRPDCVSSGRLRGDIITSHDLLAIARGTGINFSTDEEDFFELGTHAIIWFGRYHLAKSVSETANKITVKDTAFSVYEPLYMKLLASIDSLSRTDHAGKETESNRN